MTNRPRPSSDEKGPVLVFRLLCRHCATLTEFYPGSQISADSMGRIICPSCGKNDPNPLKPLSDDILNPRGRRLSVFCVFRKDHRGEFWDVDCVGLTKEKAAQKAAIIDEVKPEWAKKHPVVRIAKGKFIEDPIEEEKHEM